jgi:hypothetical protein
MEIQDNRMTQDLKICMKFHDTLKQRASLYHIGKKLYMRDENKNKRSIIE